MSTARLATELCGCGGIVARGASSPSPSAGGARGGEVWRSTTRAVVSASREGMSNIIGHMGPSSSQQVPQFGMDGANSVTRRGCVFGLGSSNGSSGGLGRRGGANFLWVLAKVSAGDKAGLDDGGGDHIGGNGGFGGGGGGGNDGPGDSPGGAGEIVPHLGVSLWLWYNGLLETHPLVSKSLTAGLMNAVADLFCQIFIEKVDELDWKRLVSFVSIGVFLSGPGLHFWYGLLPSIVPVPGFTGVLLRIALDQLIFTPLGMISFFVVLLTLEDRRDTIRTKLEKDLWPTIITNWKVWIPFQVMNFGFIPPQLQVAAAGMLGMIWSVFISYKGHS